MNDDNTTIYTNNNIIKCRKVTVFGHFIKQIASNIDNNNFSPNFILKAAILFPFIDFLRVGRYSFEFNKSQKQFNNNITVKKTVN